MLELVDMGLFIGLNGCSLKTEENVEVVKDIPIDRIMLETDAPYCEIKNSSVVKEFVKTKFPAKDKKKFAKGYLVKGRNEPCRIIEVLEAIAAIKEVEVEELAEIAYENSVKMFARQKN